MKEKPKVMNIDEENLNFIKEDLYNIEPELIIKCLTDQEQHEKLEKIILKKYHRIVKDIDMAHKVVSEVVGTGIIEELISKDSGITDIGFNGTDLIINSKDKKLKYKKPISEEYIVQIVNKFANATGQEFSPKNPILDAVFDNIRINAVHRENSFYGTTMSMRVSKAKLVINEYNFSDFAPNYMYEILKAIVMAESNITICGETGAGKTEVQKLLISFIPFEQKIVMIEDVVESHVKEMFKDKDIVSWLVGNGKTITDLIKASLRNNPKWIIISETRGQEAYEMHQAVLSGHKIITTLHSVDNRAVPKRLFNMASIGFNVNEESMIEDILKYFNFGLHLREINIEGRTIRYLHELVEFTEQGCTTIFKATFIKDRFVYEIGEFSKAFKSKLLEKGIEIEIPKANSFDDEETEDTNYGEDINKENGEVCNES